MPHNNHKLLADLAAGRMHGTLRGYTDGGCRCKWCRAANAAYHGANQARLNSRYLRVVESDALTARITVELSDDELALWTERARSAGLSRQAYIRRCLAETIALELTLERQREQELAKPLLELEG